jgi:hypothetical protein
LCAACCPTWCCSLYDPAPLVAFREHEVVVTDEVGLGEIWEEQWGPRTEVVPCWQGEEEEEEEKEEGEEEEEEEGEEEEEEEGEEEEEEEGEEEEEEEGEEEEEEGREG